MLQHVTHTAGGVAACLARGVVVVHFCNCLLRRGLHEVSSEGKVSAQVVMEELNKGGVC